MTPAVTPALAAARRAQKRAAQIIRTCRADPRFCRRCREADLTASAAYARAERA